MGDKDFFFDSTNLQFLPAIIETVDENINNVNINIVEKNGDVTATVLLLDHVTEEGRVWKDNSLVRTQPFGTTHKN